MENREGVFARIELDLEMGKCAKVHLPTNSCGCSGVISYDSETMFENRPNFGSVPVPRNLELIQATDRSLVFFQTAGDFQKLHRFFFSVDQH